MVRSPNRITGSTTPDVYPALLDWASMRPAGLEIHRLPASDLATSFAFRAELCAPQSAVEAHAVPSNRANMCNLLAAAMA